MIYLELFRQVGGQTQELVSILSALTLLAYVNKLNFCLSTTNKNVLILGNFNNCNNFSKSRKIEFFEKRIITIRYTTMLELIVLWEKLHI